MYQETVYRFSGKEIDRVFNYVNLHMYHYAGNNPVKYVDPDGMTDIDHDNKIIHADMSNIRDLELANRQLSILQEDGYIVFAADKDENEIHFRSYRGLLDYLEMVDPTDTNFSGTFFIGLQLDLVAIYRVSVNIAMDFNDLLNSGINFSGGIASGANVGLAGCIGYGVGTGMSVSSQQSWTLSPRKVFNLISR